MKIYNKITSTHYNFLSCSENIQVPKNQGHHMDFDAIISEIFRDILKSTEFFQILLPDLQILDHKIFRNLKLFWVSWNYSWILLNWIMKIYEKITSTHHNFLSCPQNIQVPKNQGYHVSFEVIVSEIFREISKSTEIFQTLLPDLQILDHVIFRNLKLFWVSWTKGDVRKLQKLW